MLGRMRLSLTLLATSTVLTLGAAQAAQAASFPGARSNFGYFASPSGRLVCEYGTGPVHVQCTAFASAVDPQTGRPGQLLFGVRSTGRGYRKVLGGNAPVEAPRARYNVDYSFRGISCVIKATTGIRCVSRVGHGFSLSVQAHRLF